ncbi:AraC family transcriptional regulator [Cupriavidus plantarum]|uniref:AraC family transcriptional activator of mtrCDE n=1 Tax=Cupriavidus plantarum TaxID=942865 RepID=A0A316EYB9_9BURK|nr:AraC family transcriptional regulator [Cupriavidus plantarum]PWK37226.1 AraC family transcriptional activator of mtrCDE [Cupriavidus plantarum]REF02037.1 AraC family transcriptional activator of mtrCDE [Cupriavidus plantarum]RLK45116.1 AraC family transcriptional activator of mtrCDE [Cupriavidus plantarum]
MDTLSDFVRLLDPSGTVDLQCRVAGAWSAHNEQAAPGHVPYHVILDGKAELTVGKERMRLVAGDVLLFPHGAAHTMRAMHRGARRAPTLNFNGVVTEVRVEGAAEPLNILCGTFILSPSSTLLLRTLPEYLHVPTASAAEREHAGNGEAGWLRGLIGMMHAEADTPRPGSAAIVADLSTALFTVLMRTIMSRGGVAHSLFALMGDARLAPAIEAIVRAPELAWTLEDIAAACNMSRATLARHFSQVGGITPLELVTTLRMERAARLLREGNLSAAAVAEQCGYASQAAFGRLFAQHFGVAPGAFRRAERDRRAAAAGAV